MNTSKDGLYGKGGLEAGEKLKKVHKRKHKKRSRKNENGEDSEKESPLDIAAKQEHLKHA